nr:hypothetical protein Iba_chr02fCG1440 [Ipomoea batatas]
MNKAKICEIQHSIYASKPFAEYVLFKKGIDSSAGFRSTTTTGLTGNLPSTLVKPFVMVEKKKTLKIYTISSSLNIDSTTGGELNSMAVRPSLMDSKEEENNR